MNWLRKWINHEPRKVYYSALCIFAVCTNIKELQPAVSEFCPLCIRCQFLYHTKNRERGRRINVHAVFHRPLHRPDGEHYECKNVIAMMTVRGPVDLQIREKLKIQILDIARWRR